MIILCDIMCKISIVMPVYNAMDFLEKSIQSLANQTFDDLELICIDDGSTDGSFEYLNELKQSYPFIKIFQQQNQGPGKARNKGMENAVGEYIGFLDSDDIFVDENALEEMYNLAKENDANVVSANLKFLELDGTLSDNPHYRAQDYAEFKSYGKIESKDYGIPYAFYKCIFKKEFLDENEIVFPDLIKGQDPIFMAKTLVYSPEIYTVPLDLYGYNHAVGGGVNVKVNNYEKRYAYMQHFKDTYDILAQGGLQDTADFYKIHLFRFLTWDENNHNPEIFEIFDDVWGIGNDDFDKSDFNYLRFIIPAKFYFLNKLDSEEFFIKTNRDFLQIDIYETFAIDMEVMDEYFMVIYSYSFEDFKSNYRKYLMNNQPFKRELMEFEINKFIFHLNIRHSPTVEKNAKLLFSSSPVWKSSSLSKNDYKKCYEILTDDLI